MKSKESINTKGTIIHFHGNAANITNHWSFVNWIPSKNFNLFTFDYRGFGYSEGKPDFDGVHQDCREAIHYTIEKLDKTGNIILLGQSIGGAFCLSATQEIIKYSDLKRRIKGLVIDSSFESFIEVAKSKSKVFGFSIFDFLTFRNLDKYSPIDAAKQLEGIPKLFIHGEKDTVVPFKHGKKLYEGASEPKKPIYIEDGKHLSMFSLRKYEDMKTVEDFLNDCVK